MEYILFDKPLKYMTSKLSKYILDVNNWNKK